MKVAKSGILTLYFPTSLELSNNSCKPLSLDIANMMMHA